MSVGLSFFKDKRIFLTGHTGFKGSWLTRVLLNSGANVTGYALNPPTEPSLWKLLGLEREVNSFIDDVRDFDALNESLNAAKPDIVIHMAAQPLVREGYSNPLYTYGTNVMGTVNLLESVRLSDNVRCVLNVTTDKVYRNNEWHWGYREDDFVNGLDPYSNSKSCSEYVTETYIRSFLSKRGVAVSTARSGNVIGGGDYAKDRVVPDCTRMLEKGEVISIRNPGSIRPYQHVLEALGAYLLIIQRQFEKPEAQGCYNVGPNEDGCVTTGELADMFCEAWGEGARWTSQSDSAAPREAGFLKLDCSKIKTLLGWRPKWSIKEAVGQTVEWEKSRIRGGNLCEVTDKVISAYFNN